MKKAEKILAFTMTLLVMLSLAACAAADELHAGESAARYGAILRGEENFTAAQPDHPSLNIAQADSLLSDDNLTARATQFALADLDGDGADEVVLWFEFNEIPDAAFLALHEIDGAVYGCAMVYRAFILPKADGTFSFSSGAFDSGFGRLTMDEDGCQIEELAASESEFDEKSEVSIRYFSEGTPCSEEEFNRLIDAQAQKEDLAWHDFTPDEINAVFGQP